MATIGLRDVYFAPILNDSKEETTYDTPIRIGGAMQANIQPQFNTADLRADDGVVATAEARGVTTVSVGVDELSKEAQAVIFGKNINADGVLVDSQDDRPPYGALMFRSEKANNAYRYVVLYKGKFSLPEEDYETKQETPAFQTRSEEHTSELQSRGHLVCRLLLEKKKEAQKTSRLLQSQRTNI